MWMGLNFLFVFFDVLKSEKIFFCNKNFFQLVLEEERKEYSKRNYGFCIQREGMFVLLYRM